MMTESLSVGMGGYLSTRRPISLVRQMAREDRPIREIIATFGGIETEMALCLSSVDRVHSGVVSLGVFGLAPNFRRQVETGQIVAREIGATSLLRSLQAGAQAVPFLPSNARPLAREIGGMTVTDLTVDDKRWGKHESSGASLIPSLRPSIAFIHVPFANPKTNEAWGYGSGPDMILASSTQKLVVSYDVKVERPPSLAGLFVCPAHLIATLEHRPLGAFPSGSYPLYRDYAPYLVYHVERFVENGDACDYTYRQKSDLNFVRDHVEVGDWDRLIPLTGRSEPILADAIERIRNWIGIA